MKIVIPGKPIAKARARVTRKGFAYDPQNKLKKETIRLIREDFDKKYENDKEGPRFDRGAAFYVSWYFHMPIPRSFNQSQKNACKWGFIQHTSKPDRSNLEKFYEDCSNGILWPDDSQIVKGEIIKKYCIDDNPRTEIYFMPLPELDEDVKNILAFFTPDEIENLLDEAEDVNHSLMNDDNKTHVLQKLSIFISKLADNYAPRLYKIGKKYPGYWKKILHKN